MREIIQALREGQIATGRGLYLRGFASLPDPAHPLHVIGFADPGASRTRVFSRWIRRSEPSAGTQRLSMSSMIVLDGTPERLQRRAPQNPQLPQKNEEFSDRDRADMSE